VLRGNGSRAKTGATVSSRPHTVGLIASDNIRRGEIENMEGITQQ